MTLVLLRIDGAGLGSVYQNEAKTARETRKNLHFSVEIRNTSKKFSRASADLQQLQYGLGQPRRKGTVPPKTAKWNSRLEIDEFSLWSVANIY